MHAPVVYEGGRGFTPFLTVPGAERAFSVFSPSKGWNLAGLKSALAVAGPGASDVRLHEVHTHGSSHLGAIAHVAAMDDGRQWQARLLGELDANRLLLGRLLAEHLPDVRWVAPEATYLAWLDCRPLGLGDDPAAVFRRRGRVALASGPGYGADAGRGFARLNFATAPEVLEDAVRRMASCLLTVPQARWWGRVRTGPGREPVHHLVDAGRRRGAPARGPRHHGDEPVRAQRLQAQVGDRPDGRRAGHAAQERDLAERLPRPEAGHRHDRRPTTSAVPDTTT